MTDAQLGEFTRAMTGVQAFSDVDDRGYQRWAGIHGLPLPIECQHSTSREFAQFFLPWHRAYLYFFERALRDIVPGVAHPWWDWTAPSPRNQGLPDAYAARQLGGGSNPLYSVKINGVAMQQARRAGLNLPPTTRRFPGQGGSRLPTTAEVDDLLAENDFFTFSSKLEDLHGAVHVWVGGDGGHMSAIPLAAYDPIFWAHHTMIDRIWRMWQLRHPAPRFTDAYLGTALAPFPMTAAQTMSVTALGYDYASGAVAATPGG